MLAIRQSKRGALLECLCEVLVEKCVLYVVKKLHIASIDTDCPKSVASHHKCAILIMSPPYLLQEYGFQPAP